jgi:hypothetical protein
MEFRFGVRSVDIEQANKWVVAATGFPPEAEDSSDLGGGYFEYFGPAGECARLFKNRDVHDGSPILEDCKQWPVVLFVEAENSEVSAVQRLVGDTTHFVLVRRG